MDTEFWRIIAWVHGCMVAAGVDCVHIGGCMDMVAIGGYGCKVIFRIAKIVRVEWFIHGLY